MRDGEKFLFISGQVVSGCFRKIPLSPGAMKVFCKCVWAQCNRMHGSVLVDNSVCTHMHALLMQSPPKETMTLIQILVEKLVQLGEA